MPKRSARPHVGPPSAEQLRRIQVWRGKNVPPHMQLLVLPWVRECVIDAGAASLKGTAQRLAAGAAIVTYSLAQGLPLDREVIFDPANVEAFTTRVSATQESTAATYRSTLRRMGPLVTRTAPWPPGITTVSRLAISAPYTEQEVRLLERASRHQPTPLKARILSGALALGLGAGLDGRTSPWVTAADIHWVDETMCISVTREPSRIVPVRKPYWATLTTLTEGLSADEYLLTADSKPRAKNRLSQALSRVELPRGVPVVDGSRLRSTWLAHHLANGARIPDLLQAAGLRSSTWIGDLIPHLPPVAPRSMLRTLSAS